MAIVDPMRHGGLPPGTSVRDLRYYSKQFKRSRDYAMQMHDSQRYGDHPYVFHLDKVAQLTSDYGLHPKYTIAAYVHDTLEDTAATKLDLMVLFGREISDLVFAVSGFGDSREEKRDDIVKKLKLRPGFSIIKLLDRIANVEQSVEDGNSSKLKMYRDEMKYYRQLFSAVHPAAYRRLCAALNVPAN